MSLAQTWDSIKERELFVMGAVLVVFAVFPYLLTDFFVMNMIVESLESAGMEGIADLLDNMRGWNELASLVLIWGIFAMGYDLLLGYTGLLSFGHAAFWGVGAYSAGYFSAHVSSSPILIVVVGTVVAVLTAWLLGYLSLRRGGIYFSILTLVFAQMMFYLASSPLSFITNGENGFTDMEVGELFGTYDLGSEFIVLGDFIGGWLYVFVAIIGVICVGIAYRILNSPYGLVFHAIHENEQRAEFVGLNVGRYKLMSFVISGFFAGVAGSLFAIHGSYVPLESLYWTTSGEVVIMSILGGTGSLFGPIFGAGVYLYIENVVVSLPVIGDFWHLILGVVFVITIAFFPSGVWGAVSKIRSLVRRSGGDR